MKIILLKFEKAKLNLVELILDSENLVFGEKEILSFESCRSMGEKYKKILDELLQINAKFSPDLFCYHVPQKIMGKTDEDKCSNEAILNLFCHENELKLEKLYKPTVRKKLKLNDKDFKKIVEEEKLKISKEQNIAKSNIALEGVTYISLLKNHL